MDDVKAEIAAICEANAAEALAERGPAVVKPAHDGRTRTLKTDKGTVVTHGQLLQGLLKRAEVEVAVQDGQRPEFVGCGKCGKPMKVASCGRVRMLCDECRVRRCPGRDGEPCGLPISKRATNCKNHFHFERLEGKRFGRLSVTSLHGRSGRLIEWNCKCECGRDKRASTSELKSGRVKSCGCSQHESAHKPLGGDSVTQMCARVGISRRTFYLRIKRGLSQEEAMAPKRAANVAA